MKAHLLKDQRNQVIGVLKVGSMVNDTAHHFDCSRQTNHNLVNRSVLLDLSEPVQDLIAHV